jgi:hypothetical protein
MENSPFAVRSKVCRAHFSGARQRGALPCGFSTTHGEKTLDKKIVCRAFFFDARQTVIFPTGHYHR